MDVILLATIYTTTSDVGSCELKEEIDEYCSAYVDEITGRRKTQEVLRMRMSIKMIKC